jgi:hypothetical protein
MYIYLFTRNYNINSLTNYAYVVVQVEPGEGESTRSSSSIYLSQCGPEQINFRETKTLKNSKNSKFKLSYIPPAALPFVVYFDWEVTGEMRFNATLIRGHLAKGLWRMGIDEKFIDDVTNGGGGGGGGGKKPPDFRRSLHKNQMGKSSFVSGNNDDFKDISDEEKVILEPSITLLGSYTITFVHATPYPSFFVSNSPLTPFSNSNNVDANRGKRLAEGDDGNGDEERSIGVRLFSSLRSCWNELRKKCGLLFRKRRLLTSTYNNFYKTEIIMKDKYTNKIPCNANHTALFKAEVVDRLLFRYETNINNLGYKRKNSFNRSNRGYASNSVRLPHENNDGVGDDGYYKSNNGVGRRKSNADFRFVFRCMNGSEDVEFIVEDLSGVLNASAKSFHSLTSSSSSSSSFHSLNSSSARFLSMSNEFLLTHKILIYYKGEVSGVDITMKTDSTDSSSSTTSVSKSLPLWLMIVFGISLLILIIGIFSLKELKKRCNIQKDKKDRTEKAVDNDENESRTETVFSQSELGVEGGGVGKSKSETKPVDTNLSSLSPAPRIQEQQIPQEALKENKSKNGRSKSHRPTDTFSPNDVIHWLISGNEVRIVERVFKGANSEVCV